MLFINGSGPIPTSIFFFRKLHKKAKIDSGIICESSTIVCPNFIKSLLNVVLNNIIFLNKVFYLFDFNPKNPFDCKNLYFHNYLIESTKEDYLYVQLS